MKPQQDQTFKQFNTGVDDWISRANGSMKKVNVIKQRNGAVLHVADALPAISKALDLGCGPGDLVLEMAQNNIDAIGIDFAPEMIKSANKRKDEENVPRANFKCGSVLELDYEPESFDLISGVGLIEYFTPEEVQELIRKCATLLRPDGALVLGSRNRLFNLYSLNSFTELELELGTTVDLLTEAKEIVSAKDTAELVKAALVRDYDLPHPKAHPKTSVDISVRYQYTPLQMIRMLADAGLQTHTLFPIHFHPLPVPAKNSFLELHISISETLNATARDDHRLLPQGSTFVIDGRKAQ